MRHFFATMCCFLTAAAGAADLRLGPLFTDHAVLQHGAPLPIWGWAEPGETVDVTFAERKASAVADKSGRWTVELPALAVDAVGKPLVVSGKGRTVTLADVVVGDVWVCSGQSNMEWEVKDAARAGDEKAGAKFPLIRHVKVERAQAEAPQATAATAGGWKTCSPDTVGSFTAVGYFFAREIHTRLGIPIGLVNASWGGSAIEPWIARERYVANPHLQPLLPRWEAGAAFREQKHREFEEAMAKWKAAEAAATAAGKPFALKQPELWWELLYPMQPTTTYNAMVAPLLPAAVRGFLWYQGESNAGRAAEYGALLRELITSWRADFRAPEAPFYVVQLANFDGENPLATDWALLRDQQASILDLPATGLAVTIDIGERKDIHPKNKQEVGRRLALIARAQVYGQSVDYLGPAFDGAAREGAAMRIRFKNTAGALTARDKPLTGFEIAGADKVFYPATASIRRDTVLVSSPKVAEPVAVRYAWRNSPEANLYSGAGLPAVPFRTDAW
ncbi:sialate O-acetylesterase [Nibricoccus sp. IMCC34717]|uniref:sialate O-acetylesterase n=1 Tax=Nibricoccus sp. IMCC34717 TaxID=3034021 RepID=UPI003850E609